MCGREAIATVQVEALWEVLGTDPRGLKSDAPPPPLLTVRSMGALPVLDVFTQSLRSSSFEVKGMVRPSLTET